MNCNKGADMDFYKELDDRVIAIEKIIKNYLPKEEGYCKKVIEAMNYSVLGPGKRLRPMLMLETYKMFGGSTKELEPFMAAIEMIHTYSLVHDDLPCMDDDEYRRGRKTTHSVYGEGMAVLAGDALLNFAFETACKAFAETDDAKKIGQALAVLADKSGIYGMIGGQTADILAENMQQSGITEELILYIHEHKTAALIQNAMMIGAILAGALKEDINTIEKIGYNIGIAFQIQDDILDVTSTLEVLGKPVGSDDKNHKVTYVTINGLEKSKEDVETLSNEAINMIRQLPGENQFLKELVYHLINRKK